MHVDIIQSFDNAFACCAGVKKMPYTYIERAMHGVSPIRTHLETTEHPSNSITTTSNTLVVALQYFQPPLYD